MGYIRSQVCVHAKFYVSKSKGLSSVTFFGMFGLTQSQEEVGPYGA